jgi:platelet-activating factor acetylhydrolase
LPEQPTDDTTLRHEQIKCRIAEIEAVVDVIRKLSEGKPPSEGLQMPKMDWEKFTSVDATKPVMAGHSLGGSAAVCLMALIRVQRLTFIQLAASSKNSIDFRAVVVFDPAVQRP